MLPKTIEELASALGLTHAQLTYWAYVAKRGRKYTSFDIPKRSAGVRRIDAPRSPLKNIQRKLLDLLAKHYRPRSLVHGFVTGRGIVSNAKKHVGKAYVLNVDIEEFFPTINFGRVRGALMAKPLGLPRPVATVIAQLSCSDNHLPQGAPTSPFLSNLICARLDSNLDALCRSLRCQYTRYADDLTISTNLRKFPSELAITVNPPHGTEANLGGALSAIIEINGFRANKRKVRLANKLNSQQVTGLVCNEFVNIPRAYVREVRAIIHAWRKFGLAAAENEYREKRASARSQTRLEAQLSHVVRGKLEFIAMVRGRYYPPLVRLAKQARELDPKMFPYPLDQEELVAAAVWVLESDSTGYQGTAFVLKDIGLVTCAHVLACDTVAFRVEAPSIRYPVVVRAIDSHVDLAILQVPVPDATWLPRGEPEKLNHHDNLLLVGFPNYGPGMHQAYKMKGHVTMTKKKSGIRYIVPSTPIAAGNSGGPLLDANYAVVGVATHGAPTLKVGAAASADEFAAVFIDYIDRL